MVHINLYFSQFVPKCWAHKRAERLELEDFRFGHCLQQSLILLRLYSTRLRENVQLFVRLCFNSIIRISIASCNRLSYFRITQIQRIDNGRDSLLILVALISLCFCFHPLSMNRKNRLNMTFLF